MSSVTICERTVNSCRFAIAEGTNEVKYIGELAPELVPMIHVNPGARSCVVTLMIPGYTYELELKPSGQRVRVSTLVWNGDRRIPPPLTREYIGPEHVGKEPLLSIVFQNSDSLPEFMWTDCKDPKFWAYLYSRGLFTLPYDEYPFIHIPNPRKKFCLDLARDGWRWKWPRKKTNVKIKLASVATIGIEAMRNELAQSLHACAEFHIRRKRSTWINDLFVHNSIELVEKVDFHVFTLVDSVSDEILAISIGYKHGWGFMDYTAATYVKSPASYGRVLMFHQGDFLKYNLGVKLWYLGFKLPYMTQLVEKRDGMDIAREWDRVEFQSAWEKS
jgi:hypothetical protein